MNVRFDSLLSLPGWHVSRPLGSRMASCGGQLANSTVGNLSLYRPFHSEAAARPSWRAWSNTHSYLEDCVAKQRVSLLEMVSNFMALATSGQRSVGVKRSVTVHAKNATGQRALLQKRSHCCWISA